MWDLYEEYLGIHTAATKAVQSSYQNLCGVLDTEDTGIKARDQIRMIVRRLGTIIMVMKSGRQLDRSSSAMLRINSELMACWPNRENVTFKKD